MVTDDGGVNGRQKATIDPHGKLQKRSFERPKKSISPVAP